MYILFVHCSYNSHTNIVFIHYNIECIVSNINENKFSYEVIMFFGWGFCAFEFIAKVKCIPGCAHYA